MRKNPDTLDLLAGRKVRLAGEFERERANLTTTASELTHRLSRVMVDHPAEMKEIEAIARDLATACYHLRGKSE